jgi:aryl-alcohol dehydrogenase-like predicted oxidoreductase
VKTDLIETNEEVVTMRYTTLGKSGLRVSRIAFGTWQLGGDWGATDEEQAIAAIRKAADEGVTLFDTAQAYGFGASERLLARALAGRARDHLVIATKGGLRPENGVARDGSPQWIRKGVEGSLRALGTDTIDLYQVHWPDPKTPLEETAGALAELVAEGKVRHVGVSNFDVPQMEAFSQTLPVETLQPPYHLFRRDIESDVLPYTLAHDIGVLVYGPLAHGLLSGQLHSDAVFPPGDWRASSDVFTGAAFRRNLAVADELGGVASDLGITLGQLAVAWVLANPAIDVAIVGTRNPDHVAQAVGATPADLGPEILARIETIVARAVPVGGPSPEGMPQE